MALINDYIRLQEKYRKLESRVSCLKTMDFMLYNYTLDPPNAQPFCSQQEMAEYFRTMLHIGLPEKWHFKEEEYK